jgi:hypothetical protein
MGSSLQRLEVLVIGLIVLVAGAVVALLMVLRPASPTAYLATTAQPIATIGTARPTSAAVQAPTSAPAAIPTAAPALVTPAATGAPQSNTGFVLSAAPMRGLTLPSLALPPIVRPIWPWLLLLIGAGGGGFVGLRIRRRRMTYTNQNVGQLLAVADSTTRADNIKVMQNLAAQGLLTAELAAAAGIDLAQPHKRRALRLPQMRLPRIQFTLPRFVLPQLQLRLPAVRMPRPGLPYQRQRPLTIDLVSPTPEPPAAVNANGVDSSALPASALLSTVAPAAPTSMHNLGITTLDDAPMRGLNTTTLCSVLAAQAIELPEVDCDTRAASNELPASWTAEDRALVVAGVVAELWSEEALRSPVVALDVTSTPASGPVMVTIDQHPDEEDRIIKLPEWIAARRATWRVAWRRHGLEVDVATDDAPPVGGPLIIPVLSHGRGGKTTRLFPLDAWRHLGLYGSNALGALHAALGSLLYAQPPSNMALAILDHDEMTPLYRNVAHLVPLPDSPRETIERLAQAITRGARSDIRPLVLVVVEPDDTMLNLLVGIAARLQARPTTPVHLILVQERLRSAGRELYAMLPALILSGGQGSPALLPGQGDWPKRGEARLVGRGLCLDGRAITLDEAAIAALLAEVRGQPQNLPPVLWDQPTSFGVLPATMRGFTDKEPVEAAAVVIREPQVVDDEPGMGAERVVDAPPSGQNELSTNDGAPDTNVDPGDNSPPVAETRTDSADTLAMPITTEPPASAEHYPSVSEVVSAADEQPATTDAIEPPCAEELLAGTATPSDSTCWTASAEPTATPDAVEMQPSDAGDRALSPLDAPDQAPTSRPFSLFRTALDAGSAEAQPLPPAPAHWSEQHATDLLASAAAPAAIATAEPPPTVEPDNGFPVGPAPLGRVAMADLLARMVATPAIIAGQPNELGVTKNRLVDLLKGAHRAQAKELAEILIAWLDLAGLLIEPTKPERLRHPRALITTNLAEIAAQLTATPCPDKGTVKAMWAESMEGRH